MPSSAVTGKNEMPSSIAVPGEMAKENAVTGGNETPTPSSEEKVKEIQAEIKSTSEKNAVSTGIFYVSSFMFRIGVGMDLIFIVQFA